MYSKKYLIMLIRSPLDRARWRRAANREQVVDIAASCRLRSALGEHHCC
jgi:hypothetical protein